MGSPPSVLILTYGIHSFSASILLLTARQEISLPYFWNPGSEDVASTESTPEITGDISQSRPVQSSLAPSAFASHLPSPYPSRSTAGRPTVALERRSAYFPGPANQTRPVKQRRNYHLSLFSTSPTLRRVPPVCASQQPSQSSQPASRPAVPLIILDKGSPACQPVRFHGPTSLPGNQAPSAVGFPQPCRVCVRAHACTAPPGSSRTLWDPPPWRSRDRECRSASNLPVSCISCTSCTS